MNSPELPKFWSTPSAAHQETHPEFVEADLHLDQVRLDAESEKMLGEALKRCSGATLVAAREFRRTGKLEYLPTVIIGIVERFVETDLRGKLKSPRDDLRLIEDLNIDSLTMMEIIILAEEVLPISINNEDLRFLRTLGDVQAFTEAKVRGLSVPNQFTNFVETRNWQAKERASVVVQRDGKSALPRESERSK